MAFKLKDGSGVEHTYDQKKLKIPGTTEGETVVFTEGEVQDSKTVTITENGTTEVTPDTGYDSVKKVGVTVDVPIEAEVHGGTYSSETYSYTEPTPDTQTITIEPSSGYRAAERFLFDIEPIQVPKIQANKSVTIEAVGKTTIMPDAEYSAMSSVDVTVTAAYTPEKTKLSKDETVTVRSSTRVLAEYMVNTKFTDATIVRETLEEYFEEIVVDVISGSTTIPVVYSADFAGTLQPVFSSGNLKSVVFRSVAGTISVPFGSTEEKIDISSTVLDLIETQLNTLFKQVFGSSISLSYSNYVYSTNFG